MTKEKNGVSGAAALWRRLNETEISISIPQAVTAVLCALTTVPLFVSATFPFLVRNTDDAFGEVAKGYMFGNYWLHCLYLLGALAGVLAMCRWWRNGRSLPRLDRAGLKARLLPVCLGLVLLWSFFSALLSCNRYISFFGTAYRQEGFVTYCFYAVLFAAGLMLSEKQVRLVMEVLAATCALIGILTIAQQQEVELFFYLEETRNAMFHNNNHYGYYLGICLPACMGLALADRRLHPLRLAEFWLICNAAAVNSVRGSFLGMAAAVAGWNLVVLCVRREKWKRLLVLDAVFVGTILWLNTGSELLDRMEHLADELGTVDKTDQEAVDDLGSGRGVHWRLGLQYATQRPLFGYGPDNLGFLYEMEERNLTDRPHNELIQIAASLGTPALIFYVTGLGSHLRSFLGCVKKLSLVQIALFASVGSYLVGSMVGNTMYYTTPYFYMILGFSYAACRETAKKQQVV